MQTFDPSGGNTQPVGDTNARGIPMRPDWASQSLRSALGFSASRPRCRSRWPRHSRLLTTALLCCAAGVSAGARGQDTAPWRVVQVGIESYARSSSYGHGYGYGYTTCGSDVQWTVDSWKNPEGLQGEFSGSASITYECCSYGGYYYGYSYDCTTYSLGVGGSISIGSDSISVQPGGCMEYEVCSSTVSFTIVFDRPMRMVWDGCCSGTNCCSSHGCPLDGSSCGLGSEEFPWGGIGPYGYHYESSYSFSFGGGAGEFSYANGVRFERMFPADVVPDGIVEGSDISAILAKWGGPYDPQRTAEDVNLDGQVSAEDLAAVLFAWGTPG